MALYPSDHFPGTPAWMIAAVETAIARAGVLASKWTVPLEAIGRYESNYGVNANFCKPDPDPTTGRRVPVGIMQQSRTFLEDTRKKFPASTADTKGLGDPVLQVLMAIKHINSELSVSGGYGGIGKLDGGVGLLPRTDRGPGNVLRAWVENPLGFSVEGARSLYRGY